METEKFEEAVRDFEKVCKMDRSRGDNLIVGNSSKCFWKVLNTHECRAKYSSK